MKYLHIALIKMSLGVMFLILVLGRYYDIPTYLSVLSILNVAFQFLVSWGVDTLLILEQCSIKYGW